MMSAPLATTRATSPAPVTVHSAADVSLVLGLVPRAPRLPSDAAALVLAAGTPAVRAAALRELIADALAASARRVA